MRHMLWVAMLAGALLASASAHAMSIGANAGFTVLTPKGGGDNVTTVGVPAGGGLLGLGFMPGLRLGSSSANGNDIYADLGLASTLASGSNITAFQGTLSFQHAFSPTGTSPFVTFGVGALLLSGDFATSSNGTLGGGLGMRGLVSQGHGVLRAEVRVDYITEDSAGFEGGTTVSFKFGFDLIMK